MKTRLSVLLLVLGGCVVDTAAQSLYGTSGWAFAPTALLAEDGTARLHYGRVDERVAPRSRLCNPDGGGAGGVGAPAGLPRCDEMILAASMVALPRLEVYVRLVRRFDVVDFRGADRSIGATFVALRQKRVLPALAFGVRDVGGTRNFHALFAVASKRVDVWSGAPGSVAVEASLGHGFDLFDANRLEIDDAAFGSLGVSVFDRVGLGAEYDTHRLNWAGWVQPVRWVRLTGALLDERYFSFTVSGIYRLPVAR